MILIDSPGTNNCLFSTPERDKLITALGAQLSDALVQNLIADLGYDSLELLSVSSQLIYELNCF